jgi:predicted ArsR family transcriptional regulator
MSQEDHPIEPPYLAVTPEQLRLMSFASRREIMAVLANDAGQSARELAVRLRRPVTGLYRHLSALLHAGLIRQSGQRRGSKRPEALYSLAHRWFSATDAVATADGKAAFAEAGSRYAAATARKLKRAMASETVRLASTDANAGFTAMDLQLDRAGAVQLNALIADFAAKARKLRVRNRAGVETISLAVIFAPNPR